MKIKIVSYIFIQICILNKTLSNFILKVNLFGKDNSKPYEEAIFKFKRVLSALY